MSSMSLHAALERFHRVLVEEIERGAPGYLEESFTVAEIYQSLVPYRTCRDRLGIEMIGDYEDALLRLLAGEGDLLRLESEAARAKIQRELAHPNPNTGVYREFAALGVRLNPDRIPLGFLTVDLPRGATEAKAAPSSAPAGEGTPTGKGRSDPRGGVIDNGESFPPDPLESSSPFASGSVTPMPTTPVQGRAPLPLSCPECAGELPERESLRFCPHCGANVHQVACRSCGEMLERSWKFCVACGTQSGGG